MRVSLNGLAGKAPEPHLLITVATEAGLATVVYFPNLRGWARLTACCGAAAGVSMEPHGEYCMECDGPTGLAFPATMVCATMANEAQGMPALDAWLSTDLGTLEAALVLPMLYPLLRFIDHRNAALLKRKWRAGTLDQFRRRDYWALCWQTSGPADRVTRRREKFEGNYHGSNG